MPETKKLTVAEYLKKALELSGLTQRELAEKVGYPKQNVISMMTLGQTKVPLDKIPLFAKALGVDPSFMMRVALQEYTPNSWEAIKTAFGDALTDREKRWVESPARDGPQRGGPARHDARRERQGRLSENGARSKIRLSSFNQR